MDIRLRRLSDTDLGLLHAWLNEPGVVRWWEGDDVSWDAVVREYGSTSNEPVEHWIATLDGRPVGWIQCYDTNDYADTDEVRNWRSLGIDGTAAGIDYLIGEPSARGRGLGTSMIRAFVADVVFGRHSAWTRACASPLTANVASIRALEKAGFSRVGTFEAEHGPATLMVMTRPTAP